MSSSQDSDEESVLEYGPDPLPEGIHSVSLACTVKDIYHIASTGHAVHLRIGRIFVTNVTLVVVMLLQFFLIWETKHLVSPHEVHAARDVYDKFEKVMYTDEQGNEHTELTVNGKRRGISERYFNASRFDLLSKGDKDSICRLPLSQPVFLITILYVWTLTCLAEMRQALSWMYRMLFAIPTVKTMSLALHQDDEDNWTIEGLPIMLKLFVVFVNSLPRLLMSLYLMWLGSRWLTATTGFSNLVLNAVALEFILLLGQVLYNSTVPFRLQKEVEKVLVRSSRGREDASIAAYFGMFMVGIISLAWVLLYVVFFQQVLPDYRWDVHEVCASLLAKELRV